MQSIIFCGDTVMPYGVNTDIADIKSLFEGKKTIINLEGAILPNEDLVNCSKWSDKYSVYSQSVIIDICKELNVEIASLCNNHILDYNYPIDKTEKLLRTKGIIPFGLKNHDIVKSGLNGKPLYIITFATCASDHSLNLYDPDAIVNDIKSLKQKEDCFVVIFPHWGVGRLRFVDPTDRKHAHRMIDAGADLIVGHHPHIIQQIEKYKCKTIVYSIGNFIFPQTYYGKKKLVYKDPAIQDELIVEWDGNNVIFHALHYDPINDKVSILKNTENYIYDLKSSLTDAEYTKIYKKKVSKVEFYIKRRLEDSASAERNCYRRRQLFRKFRRFLIKIGVHKPK